MAVAIGQVWVGCCPSCHPLGVGKKFPDFFGSPKPSWLLRLRDNSGYSTLHPGKGCLTPPIQFNDQYGYISPFLICGQSWWWIITSSLLMARNWVSNPRLKPSLLGQIFHFWSPLLWFALCRYSLIASTAPCCTAWANGCGWVQIPSASWSLRRWRNSWSCTARSPGLGGFHKIPNSWMVYTSLYMFILENPMKMDDLWVPPFFRKPPHEYPVTTYKRELQFYLSPDPGQQYLLGRLSHYLSDCHGYFILHDSLANMQMRSYWVYICKAHWAIPFKMHFHFRPLLRVTSRNFRENLPVSYIWCTRIIHNILLSPT